jgi:hypothetical protein
MQTGNRINKSLAPWISEAKLKKDCILNKDDTADHANSKLETEILNPGLLCKAYKGFARRLFTPSTI